MIRIFFLALAVALASCSPQSAQRPSQHYEVDVEYGTPLYELIRRVDPDTRMPRVRADEGPARHARATMMIVRQQDRDQAGWRQGRPHELVAFARQYGSVEPQHYGICAFGTLIEGDRLAYDRGNFYLWQNSCRWALLVREG